MAMAMAPAETRQTTLELELETYDALSIMTRLRVPLFFRYLELYRRVVLIDTWQLFLIEGVTMFERGELTRTMNVNRRDNAMASPTSQHERVTSRIHFDSKQQHAL